MEASLLKDNRLYQMTGMPHFSQFDPADVEPAINALLAQDHATIEALVAHPETATWQNTLLPLEDVGDHAKRVWQVAGHINGVTDSEALRETIRVCTQTITEHHTWFRQNEQLYACCKHIIESGQYAALGAVEQRIIDNYMREFRLAGITLPQSDRGRYGYIVARLAEVQEQYKNQLKDATKAWWLHVPDLASIEAMPEADLAVAVKEAQDRQRSGYIFTLKQPSFVAFMTYCSDRALREEMYRAFTTQASDQGPNAGQFDNTPQMVEILELRRNLAHLLGFDNYAAYALEDRMAESTEQVLSFLDALASVARPAALRDLSELTEFAYQEGFTGEFMPWDTAFYSERLRKHRYQITQEELRPYFPLPTVMQGLFDITSRLFGVSFRERHDVDVWHPDVQFYDVLDGTGTVCGGFYLDLYARDGKRGGAWMDECIGRRRYEWGVRVPIAFLTANLTPPVGGAVAHFKHNEIVTLFHEFGHGLNHMLTLVDYASVSGINGVVWDAVEFPSQFLENFLWQPEVLRLISGGRLPEHLLTRMLAARNFQSGLQFVRQLEFAYVDFNLHMMRGAYTGNSIQSCLDEVRRKVAVIIPPAYNRFLHGFGHIFAGGYAAGYYSYKWAEVLSADAFSAFEENGPDGILDPVTGRRFLPILQSGGSRDMMEMYVEFRGRRPTTDALLRHSGLTA